MILPWSESAKQACQLWVIPSTDILGPIAEAIASHLGVSPYGLPRVFPLSEDYF
ncbi:hypothetical protein SLEP1_g49229 [Rubroshorea leprosula]|uniref:Uncharacterized protein n=1 Tax=Rubroshorea leprosula TaxID=152421 RepID=A0AAV5LX41_9ROSI|nr:hypothetical protein SLEP1_g49229 [Rubroshorea leprosula]